MEQNSYLALPRYAEPDRKGLDVFWDLKAGLVVSPNVTHLPRNIPAFDEASDFRQNMIPKLLTDASIYLAFRPRYVRNTGDLFARLNLNRAALAQQISPVPGLKFMLSATVIERWARLEDALLDVCTTLLNAVRIPSVEYPNLPWHCGYRDGHRSRDIALRCAVRARDAFVELSALVSFSISLHMTPGSGPTSAFKLVQEKSPYKPTRAWFDLLLDSYVCNFNANFRVGGFINAYNTHWINYVENFTRVEVPIWIHWGHLHRTLNPVNAAAKKYLPDESQIQLAKSRAEATLTFTMPTTHYNPIPSYSGNRYPPATTSAFSFPATSHSNNDDPMGMASPQWQMPNSPVRDSPLSPSPCPPSPLEEPFLSSEEAAARKETALAALEEHFRRHERNREILLANEEPPNKQQRESWEQHARTAMLYTSKSPVYEWRELPNGTYERVKLTSAEVQDIWENYTRNQRRYVGHINTWELCPQLPSFSAEFPQETEPFSDDETDYPGDDERPSLNLQSAPPPRAATDEFYTEDVRQLAPMHTVNGIFNGAVERFDDFANFIKYRFGYDIYSLDTYSDKIVPSSKAYQADLNKALVAIGFAKMPVVQPDVASHIEMTVVNLVHTLSNNMWRFDDLPAAFDYTGNNLSVSLWSETLQIIHSHRTEHTQYIICKQGYVDKCPWGILVADASTVLLIFRHRWPTVSVIARNLIALGVPFHTVVAADATRIDRPIEPVRGLGTRPNGYKPTADDYKEYVRRRRDLLFTGAKGRAALMYGGLVARIARDVLEGHTVLEGPSDDAVTVGQHQRFYLYDDLLTENDTNIICGVYYVDVESPTSKQVSATANFINGTKSHLSFWPKDTTWSSTVPFRKAGWSEMAEMFYQSRKARIEQTFEVLSASKWRTALRFQNTLTKEVEAGTEHYQAGYLEDYHRRTRFVSNMTSCISLITHLSIFRLLDVLDTILVLLGLLSSLLTVVSRFFCCIYLLASIRLTCTGRKNISYIWT
jgi:hypothetical protein